MESHHKKRLGRPAQVNDSNRALLLALYRLRPVSKRRPGHRITREEYLDDAAARRMTYGPDGKRLFRWSSSYAIRRHLDKALELEKIDAAFAERVQMYVRLLRQRDEPRLPVGSRHIVAGPDGTNIEFSNMEDALACVRALKAGRPQISS